MCSSQFAVDLRVLDFEVTRELVGVNDRCLGPELALETCGDDDDACVERSHFRRSAHKG